MDLALNNLQRLIYYKTQTNKQLLLDIIYYQTLQHWNSINKNEYYNTFVRKNEIVWIKGFLISERLYIHDFGYRVSVQ